MVDKKDLVEKLLERDNELMDCRNELQTWTESLEELSEIQSAFATDGRTELDGKTILDIGTDGVKPLFIALKFRPDKIVGINEYLSYSYTSDLSQKSKRARAKNRVCSNFFFFSWIRSFCCSKKKHV